MYFNPKVAIDQGWITFPEWMTEDQKNECIQPNAIDFTLDHIQQLDSDSVGWVRKNNSKQFKTLIDLPFPSVPGDLELVGGSSYDITSDFFVTVPDNVACELIIRSTFSRMGCLFGNGLYDTGFRGNIGCMLHCLGGNVITEKGTRVGQIKFVQADSAGAYSGGYNTDPGQHWSESKNTNKEG